MFYEIARAIVQKIFQDKILAGLVIVGFLAIFVGGFGGGSHDHVASGSRDKRTTQQEKSAPADAKPQEQHKPEAQGQAAAAIPSAQAAKLEPVLATQFVSWWISKSMDFNPQTVFKNRQEAISWVSPEAQPKYQAAFWPPEISGGITDGSIVGSFTPTGVNAMASNPDGSVVVNVTGNLVLQQGQRPAVQQLSTDYLVKRQPGGLRICDLYNRAVLIPNSSTY